MDNNFVCVAHLRKDQRSWIKVVIKNGFVYQEVKNYKKYFLGMHYFEKEKRIISSISKIWH